MRPPTPRGCSTGHAGAENTNTPPDDTIIYAADTRHKRDCSTRACLLYVEFGLPDTGQVSELTRLRP